MFDTASAIFWMYNDCWPAVRSWTIVDYYLRRTPAFHPVRRAFQPLAVALAVEDETRAGLRRQRGAGLAGRAALRPVRAGRAAIPLNAATAVELPANASTLIGRVPAGRMASGWATTTHGAFAILSRGRPRGRAGPRCSCPSSRRCTGPKAEVSVRREDGRAIFESDVFAWRVCLDLDGEHAAARQLLRRAAGHPDRARLAAGARRADRRAAGQPRSEIGRGRARNKRGCPTQRPKEPQGCSASSAPLWCHMQSRPRRRSATREGLP